MAQPWSRVLNSTIKNYSREREINILRNRKLSALLKKRGRITYNWDGTAMQWPVKYKRIRPTPYADGETLEFSRKERDKNATLGWRAYSMTDSMSKQEFLMNRGKEAIIKLFSIRAEELMDDMEEYFGEEFYVDGTLPQNSKRIHGIESFMQAVQNPSNGGAGPTGTFAGLSCQPGFYGGSWYGGPQFNANLNNGWPNGKGDPQWDFWSPIIVDYGDTLFSSTPTWTANNVNAIAYGIIKGKKSKSLKGSLDLILIEEEMYRIYINNTRSLQRIVVERGTNPDGITGLGFTDVISQDGVDISWEYGMPPGVGYGFNVDMMELRSMQGQLFVPQGPEQDISSKNWKWSLDFFGNCVWNPKFFVKWVNLTQPNNPL